MACKVSLHFQAANDKESFFLFKKKKAQIISKPINSFLISYTTAFLNLFLLLTKIHHMYKAYNIF